MEKKFKFNIDKLELTLSNNENLFKDLSNLEKEQSITFDGFKLVNIYINKYVKDNIETIKLKSNLIINVDNKDIIVGTFIMKKKIHKNLMTSCFNFNQEFLYLGDEYLTIFDNILSKLNLNIIKLHDSTLALDTNVNVQNKTEDLIYDIDNVKTFLDNKPFNVDKSSTNQLCYINHISRTKKRQDVLALISKYNDVYKNEFKLKIYNLSQHLFGKEYLKQQNCFGNDTLYRVELNIRKQKWNWIIKNNNINSIAKIKEIIPTVFEKEINNILYFKRENKKITILDIVMDN